MTNTFDLIIIGGGVIGAFHAYLAAQRGLKPLLIERGDWPADASVRNFGMIIPSGMEQGEWQRRARLGVETYRTLGPQIGLPIQTGGTQYLATTEMEQRVLEEFAALAPEHDYECELLDAHESAKLNPCLRTDVCRASLLFPGDLRIEPRQMLRGLIPWLVERHGVEYRSATVAVGVECQGETCRVTTARGETHFAPHVFICSGADYRTLLPEFFARQKLVYCKLQMLRTEPQPGVKLAASLASGLSLRRYHSFQLAPSWRALQDEPADPELLRRGIHLLFVQDEQGRLVIGDSHEYSATPLDETLDATTESFILAEARRLVSLPHWNIHERWHGVYPQHQERELFEETIDGRIHVVTGIGGKGMTTGPGVAHDSIARWFGA